MDIDRERRELGWVLAVYRPGSSFFLGFIFSFPFFLFNCKIWLFFSFLSFSFSFFYFLPVEEGFQQGAGEKERRRKKKPPPACTDLKATGIFYFFISFYFFLFYSTTKPFLFLLLYLISAALCGFYHQRVFSGPRGFFRYSILASFCVSSWGVIFFFFFISYAY